MNPVYEGIKINTGLDLFAKPFSMKELEDVYYDLSANAEDEALLFEAASLDEIEAEYNPGEEMVMEAVTVRRFSQTKRRMAALVRALNKYFAGGITAEESQIGKVKKSGLFASVTVQIPLSDGQVISIVFHSPDEDNKRIAPDDEIIAFRWLLNKRDITQAVSPEQGREVSLEQIAKRITQIAAKNSERFQKRQKQVGEQKAALRTANADLEIAKQAQDDLLMEITAQKENAEDISLEIENTRRQLDDAIALNERLQMEIDRLRAEAEGEQAKKDTEDKEIEALKNEASGLGMSNETIQALLDDGKIDALKEAVRNQKLQNEHNAQADESGRLMMLGQEKVPGIRLQEAEEAGRAWEAKERGDISQEDWDKYVVDLYASGKARKPEAEKDKAYNTKPEPDEVQEDTLSGRTQKAVKSLENYGFEEVDREITNVEKVILNLRKYGKIFKAVVYFEGSDNDNIVIWKGANPKNFFIRDYNNDVDAATNAIYEYIESFDSANRIQKHLQKKFKSRSTASLKRSLETKKGNIDDETMEFTRRMKEQGKTWKFDGSGGRRKVVVFDEGQEPEPDEAPPATEPEAVQMLRNILNGDLDDAPDALDQALDRAAEELEEAGLMDEYDELLNEAADHYTTVLEEMKEAA